MFIDLLPTYQPECLLCYIRITEIAIRVG